MLHPLPVSAQGIMSPMQFTYPFCYVPHPLCQLAAEEVKRVVRENAEWNAEVQEGKMLGVLVVEGGFLAAFSGTLCGKSTLPYFVPPVFDVHGTYFA
jgi:tRNA pseudouridine32 synthase/23S rRNA pseudouridine746 synthase